LAWTTHELAIYSYNAFHLLTDLFYPVAKDLDFETRLYLENPLSEIEIQDLLEKLEVSVNEIIRKKEELWKESFSSKTYTEQELISILANHPKLLQRPIVIIGNKAIIARDLEKLEQFLDS
jgi:arsenate reductase